MVDSPLPIVSKIIEPETIFIAIDNSLKFTTEIGQLNWIQKALKNGVLNSLTVVDTVLGYVAQPSLPLPGLGIYIIGNQHHQIGSPHKKWWILVKIAAEVAGQK